jgi:hypothetical protein
VRNRPRYDRETWAALGLERLTHGLDPSPMTLQSLAPMLRTQDLRATVAFWRDNVNIMVALPNEHEGDKLPTFTGSLYMKTTDYDNNGYVLQFGQPVSAMKRIIHAPSGGQ